MRAKVKKLHLHHPFHAVVKVSLDLLLPGDCAVVKLAFALALTLTHPIPHISIHPHAPDNIICCPAPGPQPPPDHCPCSPFAPRPSPVVKDSLDLSLFPLSLSPPLAQPFVGIKFMVCNLLDCGSRKHVLPMGAPMVDLTLAEPFLALGSRAEELDTLPEDTLTVVESDSDVEVCQIVLPLKLAVTFTLPRWASKVKGILLHWLPPSPVPQLLARAAPKKNKH